MHRVRQCWDNDLKNVVWLACYYNEKNVWQLKKMSPFCEIFRVICSFKNRLLSQPKFQLYNEAIFFTFFAAVVLWRLQLACTFPKKYIPHKLFLKCHWMLCCSPQNITLEQKSPWIIRNHSSELPKKPISTVMTEISENMESIFWRLLIPSRISTKIHST